MNDKTLLGPWVPRFLLEHLVAERNLVKWRLNGYKRSKFPTGIDK
jgi:hypothetical protein